MLIDFPLPAPSTIFILLVGIILVLLVIVLFQFRRKRTTGVDFVVINDDLFGLGEQRKRKIAYQKYIKSPEWEKLKNAALKAAKFRCENCGAPAQTVHHLKYPESFSEDSLENLQVLCHGCHFVIHKKQIEANKRTVDFRDSFLAGRQHFRFEVKKAKNDKKYLVIHELRAGDDGKFNDRKILIFQENLAQFEKLLANAKNHAIK